MNYWERKKIIAVGILALLVVGYNIWHTKPAKLDVATAQGNKIVTSKNKEKRILVHITGAVTMPGIYEIPEGIRAAEAIAKAGGFTIEADQSKVNLVRKVKDGMHIRVPEIKTKKEKTIKENKTITASGTIQTSELINVVEEKININSAGKDALQTLKGIGPALAQKIIDYRTANKFTKIEDILLVSGISDKKFLVIKDKLTVK